LEETLEVPSSAEAMRQLAESKAAVEAGDVLDADELATLMAKRPKRHGDRAEPRPLPASGDRAGRRCLGRTAAGEDRRGRWRGTSWTSAEAADPGFHRAIFALALGALDQISDAAFASYGVDPTNVQRLRSQFADWRSRLEQS
jgi:hypothetical protein